MADALIKAWHGVFDRGSKQAQERLKKVHGHKPEFQAFLKSRGIEGGERSAKQATTSLKKATDTKVAAQKIADMRFKKALQASSDRVREMGRRRREGGEGLGGSLETTKDVIAHIKQYGSIKAGRLGEAMDRTQLIGKVAKDIEKKKAATKIVDRLKTISYGRGAGLNPAKDMKLNPSSPLKTDMSALSNKRHSMNYEEVQIDEVSKAEAEKVLGGAVKEKPKMPPGKQPAGYRYVRGLARRAMKGGVSAIHKSMEKTMAKEEVEQVVEQDDSMEKKEWYQNKLSKVQSEVESLHSYIEGEKRRTGMVEEVEQIDEKAPPGAKYERMVKHIKKGYAKGGLTPQEKSIAYATAWKAYGKKNEEVEQIDELKKSTLASYVGKAAGRLAAASRLQRDFEKDGHTELAGDFEKSAQKKKAGIQKAANKLAKEEVVTEAEGTVAVTPKEKALAAHHGDPKKITYGDVIKARLKSAAAKKMGK